MQEHQICRSLWRGVVQKTPSENVRSICQIKLDGMVADGAVLAAGIYRWKNHIFAYFEGIGRTVQPDWIIEELHPYMCTWPGKDYQRYWVEMNPVFHFNEPQGLKHWKRKTPVESHVGKIGVLQPNMVASYVYYHYGLQEERTFNGDKYEIIGLHENVLFGYFEYPAVIEEPIHKQNLQTKSMPSDWAKAQIPQHFVPWDDFEGCLRPMALWAGSWEE